MYCDGFINWLKEKAKISISKSHFDYMTKIGIIDDETTLDELLEYLTYKKDGKIVLKPSKAYLLQKEETIKLPSKKGVVTSKFRIQANGKNKLKLVKVK